MGRGEHSDQHENHKILLLIFINPLNFLALNH